MGSPCSFLLFELKRLLLLPSLTRMPDTPNTAITDNPDRAGSKFRVQQTAPRPMRMGHGMQRSYTEPDCLWCVWRACLQRDSFVR